MRSLSVRTGLLTRALLRLAAILFCLGLAAAPLSAQPADLPQTTIRTDSPQDTFDTFLRLSAGMETALLSYIDQPDFPGLTRLAFLSDQMNAVLDLSQVPAASRREVGITTFSYLMDIFGRIDPVDPESLPDEDALELAGETISRIPGTPIYISRVSDGDRAGEFLFSPSTVEVAPRFFRAVQTEPLRTRLDTTTISGLGPQLTGPLIPPFVLQGMPEPLKRLWLDTPVWKVATVIVLIVLLAVATAVIQRALAAVAPGHRLGGLFLQTLMPVTVLLAAGIALPFFAFQINVSGRFADFVTTLQAVLNHVAYAWVFWLVMRMLFEWVILSPRIPDTSLDANLLRLASKIIGTVGVVVILAFGAQSIGLPIMSVLAGLGIGGLAMALALRPTLENLVGGVILYIDRPVRVGDFCSFGDQKGTVEGIGVRSTTLRALDRTLISVPNAQFADMQIINFAYCDQLLIEESLGLRYETTPDQLRYVLTRLRQMLHAHPRIDSDTVRVRFAGYGDNALRLNMRVYALSQEWNDFFAIREDVFLRIYDIVTEAGTGFAFPSQTVYLARDGGIDPARGAAAEATVAGWRRTGNLPFPRLTAEEIARLNDTLDYPPHGSSDSGPIEPAAEPLSADVAPRVKEETPAPSAATDEAQPPRR
jgi:MscS family membrane protein